MHFILTYTKPQLHTSPFPHAFVVLHSSHLTYRTLSSSPRSHYDRLSKEEEWASSKGGFVVNDEVKSTGGGKKGTKGGKKGKKAKGKKRRPKKHTPMKASPEKDAAGKPLKQGKDRSAGSGGKDTNDTGGASLTGRSPRLRAQSTNDSDIEGLDDLASLDDTLLLVDLMANSSPRTSDASDIGLNSTNAGAGLTGGKDGLAGLGGLGEPNFANFGGGGDQLDFGAFGSTGDDEFNLNEFGDVELKME